jgi:hypothetical protein
VTLSSGNAFFSSQHFNPTSMRTLGNRGCSAACSILPSQIECPSWPPLLPHPSKLELGLIAKYSQTLNHNIYQMYTKYPIINRAIMIDHVKSCSNHPKLHPTMQPAPLINHQFLKSHFTPFHRLLAQTQQQCPVPAHHTHFLLKM